MRLGLCVWLLLSLQTPPPNQLSLQTPRPNQLTLVSDDQLDSGDEQLLRAIGLDTDGPAGERPGTAYNSTARRETARCEWAALDCAVVK